MIQTHAENQTAHKAQLKHTLAELGSVTPSNAKDGMDANRLFAGEAEDALGAWVETDKNERIWRPIVAAVDAASVEIRPGEEKMVYWYGFSSRRKTAHGLKCTGAVGKNSAADSAQFHIKPPEKAFVLPSGSCETGNTDGFPEK